MPWLWPLLGALAGLVAGSFLATVALRWPAGRPITGRSACDGCGSPLGVVELVPILSFLWLRGRCRRCGAAIDRRHPAFELAAALIGAMALAAVPGPAGLAGALFGWGLLLLLALDLEHYWLPDAIVLPLLALGLLAGPAQLADRALAAALLGGGLLVLRLGFAAVRGREGLGLGDVKLGAAIGAWLSPLLIGPFLLLSALVGLWLAWAVRRRTGRVQVPFGAAMAVAAFPLWLWLAGARRLEAVTGACVWACG
jgi:leader peptidase (prepilin peptidase)/N-methyltransferase